MITETTLKLQKYRKKHGFTQVQACLELNIPLRTWIGWESEGRSPAAHEWAYLNLMEELWAGRTPVLNKRSVSDIFEEGPAAHDRRDNRHQPPPKPSLSPKLQARLDAFAVAKPDRHRV